MVPYRESIAGTIQCTSVVLAESIGLSSCRRRTSSKKVPAACRQTIETQGRNEYASTGEALSDFDLADAWV
jgi:hypothetical protein